MRLKKGEPRFLTEVSGGCDGFARVAGSAVSPNLLERVLLQGNDSLPLAQAHGLAALDRLAAPGGDLDQLVSRRSAWLVNNYVDDELHFALGLDQATTAGKLRAIVARAYLRGWRYADRAGATRAAEGRGASCANGLGEVLALMTFGRREANGPDDFSVVDHEYLRSLVDDFHLLTTNRRSEVIERRQLLEEAFWELARMHRTLKVRATSAGRPFHEELFFFAVCLGEAFTILTGLRPIFDHSFRKRSGSLDWRDFLDAVFVLCGLASKFSQKVVDAGGHGSAEGMPGDILTDKLRQGPPRKEGDRAPIWSGYFEHLADLVAEPPRRGERVDSWRLHHAALNSAGLDLDYEREVPEPGQLPRDRGRARS